MSQAGVDLAGVPWPAVPDRTALVVPIGSFEQHGPHLPLNTDTRIAEALAGELVGVVSGLIRAPALAYGASGEHSGFPGTLSIGSDALEMVLVELIRSADHFRGVVLVNGHGGNVATLSRVARRCADESRAVLVWSPSSRVIAADAHAGRFETSLMLHLAPTSVDMTRAESGNLEPLDALLERIRADGVASVSPNGVLGDPAGADATEGAEIMAVLVADLVAAVRLWMDSFTSRDQAGT